MNIDFAFIMCAGKGTRMGKIGQVLPKPLWPIYEITLLELQIIYAKKLGVREIFINSHHCHEQMVEALNSLSGKYSNLNLSYEPKLQGSGGGVHQFCRHSKVNYSGSAVYLSGDQFLFFSDKEKASINQIFQNKGSCLVANDISGFTGYNRILFDKENNLTEIQSKYDHTEESYTFSGMGYLNLELIDPLPGNSSFFDSVCNYKKRSIGVYPLEKQEYWDFGTLDRYYHSCFNLIKEINREGSLFFENFSQSLIFDLNKLDQKRYSYRHKMDNALSFQIKSENKEKDLIIVQEERKKLSFGNIVDFID